MQEGDRKKIEASKILIHILQLKCTKELCKNENKRGIPWIFSGLLYKRFRIVYAIYLQRRTSTIKILQGQSSLIHFIIFIVEEEFASYSQIP